MQNVHVIDDDPALLDSVGLLLRTEGYAVKTYSSAEDFLEAIGPGDAGCIVTDVRMAGMSGLELLAKLKERGAFPPVIVITAHGDIPLAVQAMKQGAVDLLEKPFHADALLKAVGEAFSRGKKEQESEEAAQQNLARLYGLSAREKEVLEGLLRGQPNKIIAFELGISQRTVEIHRANLMKKTGAASLAELVRLALAPRS